MPWYVVAVFVWFAFNVVATIIKIDDSVEITRGTLIACLISYGLQSAVLLTLVNQIHH